MRVRSSSSAGADRRGGSSLPETLRRAACVFLGCHLASLTRAAAPLADAFDLVDGARALGMGGASAALARDASAAWRNPAAGAAETTSLTIAGQRGFIEDAAWHALAAIPLSSRAGAFAAAVLYDSGPVTVALPDGSVRAVAGQRDWLGLAGGAVRLAGPPVTVGASVRALRTDLIEQYTATGAAADLGAVVEAGEHLAVGGSVERASGGVRYRAEALAAEWAGRAGVLAGVRTAGTGEFAPARIALLADASWAGARRRVSWHLGAEAAWPSGLAVRTGATRGRDASEWRATLGLGVRVRRITLDYAATLAGPATFPQSVSLSVLL